jgi:hypothetical protein
MCDTHIHAYMHTHIHTHIGLVKPYVWHTHTHIHAYTHTHTYRTGKALCMTHTYTHTHIHTHIGLVKPSRRVPYPWNTLKNILLTPPGSKQEFSDVIPNGFRVQGFGFRYMHRSLLLIVGLIWQVQLYCPTGAWQNNSVKPLCDLHGIL